MFLTAVIDALESREVAVLDAPGAFMQADIDELVHVRFTGEMVSMLLHIDNDMYKDYVVTEKGKMVMYMELLKALYGTLCTARLFWQKLSKQLIDVWGFTPNKYDDCVVNKIINGHQMSVVWHVDDLKVSHVHGKEVDKFIMQMEETFGADAPLSVSHGKIHDYLGMNLNFRVKGEVRIDMEHYIDMMLQDAPGLCPHDLFFKTRWSQAKFHDLHMWGCPVYVLDKTLSDDKKLPRWTPRSHREVFMGLSPKHSSTVPLVLNPGTGAITPQYHVVFDDEFTTIGTNEDSMPDLNSDLWAKLFGDSSFQFVFDDESEVHIADLPDEEDPYASALYDHRRSTILATRDTVTPVTPLPVPPPPATPFPPHPPSTTLNDPPSVVPPPAPPLPSQREIPSQSQRVPIFSPVPTPAPRAAPPVSPSHHTPTFSPSPSPSPPMAISPPPPRSHLPFRPSPLLPPPPLFRGSLRPILPAVPSARPSP